MPIKIPDPCPPSTCCARGRDGHGRGTALRQDIRPLQIALLNLMPNKERTETQFARLIGATPLQIELTLIRMTEHEPRTRRPSTWRPSTSAVRGRPRARASTG
jgi:homoserine O-succinyltransferase/O-acetyltransferase